MAKVMVEATAEAMAKVMVEATAQAAPTATPIPPSPTPTATPIPPSPTPTATPIPPSPTPTATPESVLDARASVNPYNSLIVDIDVTLRTPAKVFVEYENRRAGRFRSRTAESADMSHHFSVARLRPLTTYSYEVFIVNEEGQSISAWQGNFKTGSLPAGLRHFETIAQGQATYPLTLKEHEEQYFSGLLVLDSQAYIVWYYESVHGVETVAQKGNGNLIYGATRLGLREITPLGEEVDRLDETCMTSAFQGQFHHEVLIRPDNRVLYLSSAIHEAAQGEVSQPQTSDIVSEWDQNKGTSRVLFDIFDFIQLADRTEDSNVSEGGFFWKGCSGAPKGVQDWTHANSLFVGHRGNVILSIRHLDQIISIAPDFQSIEWRLGGPGSDFTFSNSSDLFYHQHSAVELRNGNILLFDNGNTRPDEDGGEYSRALEIHLDFDEMSARKVWQYRHDPDLFAGCCSNVTRLPNGNTVMVFGADFVTNQCCRVFTVVEANPSGEKIFEIQMRSPQMAVQYRVYPISSINGETQIED